MSSFHYERPTDRRAAILAAARPGAVLMGGGTDLIQLLKAGVSSPSYIVDVSALPDLDRVRLQGHGVRIGALARMADVADHPDIKTHWTLISESLLASASAQIRNVATIGGNLLQRTRCPYFRDPSMPCNKRAPGTGCPAISGEHRNHAIFGTSAHCIATHASDLAVALIALDATLEVEGPEGARDLPLSELYLTPEDHPDREVTLHPGELITAVVIDDSTLAHRSAYLKIRDRASFEFAVVSVAVAMRVDTDQRIESVRLAAGGVGTKPWRLSRVEAALHDQPAVDDTFRRAAELAIGDARPCAQNAFKPELLKRAITRALSRLAGIA